MRRPLAACLVLCAVYVVLSLANDPHGTLGTDTGGKVATLRSMEQHGGAVDPDVGYWAAHWDPTGTLHPLYYTYPLAGRWVNVTTLPVLYLAYPLYRLGGYRLTLLLPMLGSVLAALGARALSRRLGGRGWLAFAVVGLLSPLVVYALDFWEHSLGVALMVWAIVLLVDILGATNRTFWPRAGAAGLLLGLAATMRTETLVYGAVATGTVCVVLLLRRNLARSLAVGALVLGGLVLPLAGNLALERATVGGSIRSTRASDAVDARHGTRVRLEEGFVTTLGLQPEVTWISPLVGAAALLLLVLAVRRVRRGGDPGPAVLAGAGAVGLYAVRAVQGLGFVPGMATASPVAAVSFEGGGRSEVRRMLLVTALGSLPVVWAFQFVGGAYAQWGGRYLLVSGVLLTTLGATALEDHPRPAVIGTVGLAAAVTAFGLVWMSSRTHDVARAEAELAHLPQQVVVSRIAHLAREGGAYYRFGGRPWLTAVTAADERDAIAVARQSGATSLAIIDDGQRATPAIPGYDRNGTRRIEFLGLHLRVISYATRVDSGG